MRHKKSAFTLIELVAVVGIIALLVALLIPAVNYIRRTAKETKQKAQFATIELALIAFKNDYGDYPPSNWWSPTITGPRNYCGAQKLAEALVGWDLMGFHPKSAWRADGLDGSGGSASYDPLRVRDINKDAIPDTLDERKGPYLEMATVNAFRLGDISVNKPGLFNGTGDLEGDTFVLCDAFGVKKITITKPGILESTTFSAGTPILYYRANTSSKSIDIITYPQPDDLIYNVRDNFPLVSLGRLADWDKSIANRRRHVLENANYFYEYIRDPKVTAWPCPCRPDSYILISAGIDGEYGTSDDICNFGN